jgi:hypothetical protein
VARKEKGKEPQGPTIMTKYLTLMSLRVPEREREWAEKMQK